MPSQGTEFPARTEAVEAATSHMHSISATHKRRLLLSSSLPGPESRPRRKVSASQSTQNYLRAKSSVAQRPDNITKADPAGSSGIGLTALGSQFQPISCDQGQGLGYEDLTKLRGRGTAFDHRYEVDEPDYIDLMNLNYEGPQDPAFSSVPGLSEGASSHSGFSSGTSYVSTDYPSENMGSISYDFAAVDSLINNPLIEPSWWPLPGDDMALGAQFNDSSNGPLYDQPASALDVLEGLYEFDLGWSQHRRLRPAGVAPVVCASVMISSADRQVLDDSGVHATSSDARKPQERPPVAPNRTECDFTELQSVHLTLVQSTAQPDDEIAICSRATLSNPAEDVATSPSDVDSHSDYEWSTETTTSVGDELLRSYRSVQQQNPKVYLQRLGALFKVALARFAAWTHEGQRFRTDGANQQPTQRPPNTTMSTTPPSQYPLMKRGREARKKSAATNGEDEEDEEDDIRGPKKPKTESPDDGGVVFACPFFRLDPIKHAECLSRTLRRIRDVKQHLVRRHLRPPFCPICGIVFDTQVEQEAHVAEQSCERNLYFSKPDGITQDQRAQLSSKSGRNLSPKEQWFCVWDIVFPEIDRPDSAYILGPFNEVTGECERFWNDNGEAVLAEWMAASGLSSDSPEAGALLPALFLDCSRHLFRLFRRQLARVASSASPPDMTESSSSRQREPSPESFLSQYNVAMATGDVIPQSFLTDTTHESNAQPQIAGTIIIEAGTTHPFEDQEPGQSSSMPEFITQLQGRYDFDDSFFTNSLELGNDAEHDAAMMAVVKTSLNQASKSNFSVDGNMDSFLCGLPGDS